MFPPELGGLPPLVPAEAHFADWFAAVADRLLNGCELVVAGEPHRVAEVEGYYSGDAHLDPFAHRHPVQLHPGRWYFHRTGDGYRGGSYKGLDLTLGHAAGYCGFLLRTLIDAHDRVTCGPSLVVDHLLKAVGLPTVARLDEVVGPRSAWDANSPLHFRPLAVPRTDAVYTTARIGLNLKTAAEKPTAPRFVMRPYRFLTDPRRVTKGKPLLVIALHQQGLSPDAIQTLTGCPKPAVARYVADYEAGRADPGFAGYFGTAVTTRTLCRLAGACAAAFPA